MPRRPADPNAAAPQRKASQPQPESQKGSWLGNTVRALFVREVHVKRVDGKPAVALEKNKAEPQAAANPDSAMRAALKALLNVAPDSRARLRFLAAVEHGLKHKDPTGLFLFEVEPERLHAALRQFDAVAPATLSEPLAALRARLVDAIGSREKTRKRLEMLPPRPAPMHDPRIEVAEARASDFDRISEQWRGAESTAN